MRRARRSAYGSAEARLTLIEATHRASIKPIPVHQIGPGGFTYDDFDIDPHAGTATCLAGHTRRIPASRRVNFAVHCRSCPLRRRCTSSEKERWLTVHQRDGLLRAARRQAETIEFQQTYRDPARWSNAASPGSPHGNRRVRYRGVTNNNHWLQHRMAALNLRRLLNLGLVRHHGAWAIA